MIKKVIAIVGATNSGKTAVAVKLAKEINGIIISADSRQVYANLNIGTNKEGEKGLWEGEKCRYLDGVPQLLIDVVEPGERFTLHDWLESSKKLIEKIWEKELIPVVVGGTGLYVSALTDGYVLGSGRNAKIQIPVDFDSLILMPTVERAELNDRSDKRFVRIFDELIAETNSLIEDGVTQDWLDNIGLDYRYAVRYLSGKITKDTAITEFQAASRSYIRRQQTWWRHHGQVHEFSNYAEIVDLVDDFLNS